MQMSKNLLWNKPKQKRKSCFKQGATAELQIAKKEIKLHILKAKQDYKSTLETKMANNNLVQQ